MAFAFAVASKRLDGLDRVAPGKTPHRALSDRSSPVLTSLGGRAEDWPLLVADTNDPRSVKALAEATSVLATTVGPYRRYGLPIVEACASAGTHYADRHREADSGALGQLSLGGWMLGSSGARASPRPTRSLMSVLTSVQP